MMKVIFLDRDGVICKDRKDYVKSWEEFEFLPYVFSALRVAKEKNYKIVIVSNQSAVGRKIITSAQLDKINQLMLEEIRSRGGDIEKIYCCIHHPDELCDCRKPKPGLIKRAAEELKINLNSAWLIGDSPKDILAGAALDLRTVLVLSGKTKFWPPSDYSEFYMKEKAKFYLPSYISSNILSAVELIVELDRG